jgi:hypothetical protein
MSVAAEKDAGGGNADGGNAAAAALASKLDKLEDRCRGALYRELEALTAIFVGEMSVSLTTPVCVRVSVKLDSIDATVELSVNTAIFLVTLTYFLFCTLITQISRSICKFTQYSLPFRRSTLYGKVCALTVTCRRHTTP